MNRRTFLKTASTVTLAAATVRAEGAPAPSRDLIEIRTYHFPTPAKRDAYAAFLSETGIAAFARAGASPVGLFKQTAADNPKLKLTEDSNDLWVILPHRSFDAFLQFESVLSADAAFQKSDDSILNSPKENPAFDRMESKLLLAFEGCPTAIAPKELSADRLLELRTYQSRNEERHHNKVSMFNSGEIPMFARAGMPPVFFGDALIGPDLPELTYMICHSPAADTQKHWASFGGAADWKAMKDNPIYKDNVSNIVNRFLRPLPGSQI